MVILHQTYLTYWPPFIQYNVVMLKTDDGFLVSAIRSEGSLKETREVTFKFGSSAYAYYSACVQVYTEMSLSQCLEIIIKEPTKLSDRTYI